MKGNGDEIGGKMIKRGWGEKREGVSAKETSNIEVAKKNVELEEDVEESAGARGNIYCKKRGEGCDKLMVIQSDTYSRE